MCKTIDNCFSKKKVIQRDVDLFESMDIEYKSSIPSKLSTIIEEKTIDVNFTADKI